MAWNRRAILGMLLGGVAEATFAQGLIESPYPKPRPPDLRNQGIPSGDALVAASGVSGEVAYAVAEATQGDMLEVRGPVLRLPPASVAKTVTSLYALEHLGPEFRFATRVLATGPVASGVVQGDLILVGSGDPTLDTDALAGLAAQVKAAGISSVTGRFLVYDGALPPIDQIDGAQTEYAGYNPTISGLNLNYNRVHFEWRRLGADYSLKMDARAEKFAPDVRIAHMQIAVRDVPVFDHQAGQGRDEWTVSRAALGNGGGAVVAGAVAVALRGRGVCRGGRTKRAESATRANNAVGSCGEGDCSGGECAFEPRCARYVEVFDQPDGRSVGPDGLTGAGACARGFIGLCNGDDALGA